MIGEMGEFMNRYLTSFCLVISASATLNAAQVGVSDGVVGVRIATIGGDTCHVRPVYSDGLATARGEQLIPGTRQDFTFPRISEDGTPLQGLEIYEGHRIFGSRLPIRQPIEHRYVVTCAVGQIPLVDEN